MTEPLANISLGSTCLPLLQTPLPDYSPAWLRLSVDHIHYVMMTRSTLGHPHQQQVCVVVAGPAFYQTMPHVLIWVHACAQQLPRLRHELHMEHDHPTCTMMTHNSILFIKLQAGLLLLNVQPAGVAKCYCTQLATAFRLRSMCCCTPCMRHSCLLLSIMTDYSNMVLPK